MEQTWLNPEYATNQIVTLAILFIASLVILAVVFGGLIYAILSVIARFTDRRHGVEDGPEVNDES